MTKDILLELLDGIKEQIQSQGNLQTYLQQANALVYVGDTSDFDQMANVIVHHYLSALKDILERASQLSEHATQALCQWSKAISKEALPVGDAHLA